MPRLAVTGAGGFVGRRVVAAARAERWEVAGLVRSEEAARTVANAGGAPVHVPGLAAEALAPALAGSEAVVHLAQIGSEKPGATYEAVNVEGTRAVAEAARQAEVPRVVFLSGLGVARYGMAPRTTNPYFLSKLRAEAALYASGLEVVVFRPSYIVGPRDGLLTSLLDQMARGEVERIGDGSYRMQPVAVRDAAQAVLAAATAPVPPPVRGPHRVLDLVGPEVVSFEELMRRTARAARAARRKADFRVREVPVAEADRRARAGEGLPPDELDCLLCDETGDPRPLEALLGRFLVPLDEALSAAVAPGAEHRNRLPP